MGSNPVASTTKNEANICWLHFSLLRTSTGFEGGGASGSERFAREEFADILARRKLNSPVGCSPGRAAKGANPVASTKNRKSTSVGFRFFIVRRSLPSAFWSQKQTRSREKGSRKDLAAARDLREEEEQAERSRAARDAAACRRALFRRRGSWVLPSPQPRRGVSLPRKKIT